MATPDYVGKFVPSDEQLRRAELLRCEFAFFSAKVCYWQLRNSLAIGDALSEAYARFLKAVEAGDRSTVDQIFRRWRVRGATLAPALSRGTLWPTDLPPGENLETPPVDAPPLGGLL